MFQKLDENFKFSLYINFNSYFGFNVMDFICMYFKGYLYTCPKNDVLLFSRKCFHALGLGLRQGLELAEKRLNTFSVERPFEQDVLDPFKEGKSKFLNWLFLKSINFGVKYETVKSNQQ